MVDFVLEKGNIPRIYVTVLVVAQTFIMLEVSKGDENWKSSKVLLHFSVRLRVLTIFYGGVSNSISIVENVQLVGIEVIVEISVLRKVVDVGTSGVLPV